MRPEGTGLTVEVGQPGHMVGFRADLDALPIQEPADNPYASQVPGVMHACGHDAHTAIAAGIALILARLDMPGRVRFVFQPGEESFPAGLSPSSGKGRGLAGRAFHVDPTSPSERWVCTGAVTGRWTVSPSA